MAADGARDDGAPGWRAAPPDALRVVDLPPLAVIYDRRSAQTHVVDPLVPAILAALGGDRLDVAAIFDRLTRDHDLTDVGDDPLAALTARLDELAALGLAIRA